jgi:hypothetical protein
VSSRDGSRDEACLLRLFVPRAGVSALVFEQSMFARTHSEHGRNGSHWSHCQRIVVEGVDVGGLTRLLFLRHLSHAALTLVGSCRVAEMFDIDDEDHCWVQLRCGTRRTSFSCSIPEGCLQKTRLSP